MSNGIIYSKNDFKFIKKKDDNYSVSIILENDKIQLDTIIDFPFLNLIYDLNRDIIEKMDIEMIDKNKGNINLVIKHLFEDLGVPQLCCFIFVEKIIIKDDDKIINYLNFRTIDCEKPDGNPIDAEEIDIKSLVCKLNTITPYKVECVFNVEFSKSPDFNSEFVERMAGMLLYKVLNRIKIFIRNICIV